MWHLTAKEGSKGWHLEDEVAWGGESFWVIPEVEEPPELFYSRPA